jgi:uncharacterized protein YbgA (DUF1722 family)/uncharacterized protein YbbK (DUF523 family)
MVQRTFDYVGTNPLRLGISSCLIGEKVRFNGGHVRDAILEDTLGRYVDWVPICPEVEIGMGIPRETIRLTGHQNEPQLIAPKSQTNHTTNMKQWTQSYLKQLSTSNLDGYVLKKDSPSCGLFRVRIYDTDTTYSRNGTGLFARELTTTFPLLPVEEEGRLHDPKLRENFIERLFAYSEWRQLTTDNPTIPNLIAFHTAHKSTLMAHQPRNQTALGRIVAQVKPQTLQATLEEYSSLFMETMTFIATTKQHTNVLQHLIGFLKTYLPSEDKFELLDLIEQYRNKQIPLIVPVTLLQHHLRKYSVPDWVKTQTYLNPYPRELSLRNHV